MILFMIKIIFFLHFSKSIKLYQNHHDRHLHQRVYPLHHCDLLASVIFRSFTPPRNLLRLILRKYSLPPDFSVGV